ncbi:MAG: hypothetical protein Q7S44_03390 [bacterium]|nr:hypothetical protein [bacterium]
MKIFFSSAFLRSKTGRLLSVLFILGLVYLIIPGPGSVEDFTPLPNSVRSDLDGDTWQNPNIAAYYADFRRDYVTKFYKDQFTRMHLFGWFLPPLKINHPPEYARSYVRDQQESTFLEEYTYPLRESIFVNGYEPLVENTMNKKAQLAGFVGNHIWYKENPYESKATLRYYPSSVVARTIVYLLIWLSAIWFWKLARRSWKER